MNLLWLLTKNLILSVDYNHVINRVAYWNRSAYSCTAKMGRYFALFWHCVETCVMCRVLCGLFICVHIDFHAVDSSSL